MRIGIIGSGQLARMMALAGWNMGLQFSFLAEEDESTRCVEGLGSVVRRGEGQSAREIYRALGEPAVITVEREHVDIALLRELQAFCQVHPSPDAVQACGDRAREKALLSGLQVPTAPYRIAQTTEQVAEAVHALGLPVVLKATTEGYDGKQQWRLHNEDDLTAFCAEQHTGNWLVESMINFEREVSFIAARSANGDVTVYPPTENRHQDGILLTSIAPAPQLPSELLRAGTEYISRLLQSMDYVGVLAMECFVAPQGLLINELAPRVHNSGHWTANSEATSQFENHLRAIVGMTLGSTQVNRCNGMINVLGHYDRERTRRFLSSDSALTDYNKSDAPRRKLAHINVSGASPEATRKELDRLHKLLYGSCRDDDSGDVNCDAA